MPERVVTEDRGPHVGERLAWSVVIPAYDEAARLPAYLSRVLDFFEFKGEPFEILVVDDGSRDNTSERVREFQRATDRVRLITLPENRGKGYAVRTGMVNASGEYRLFTDADGATPIGELPRLEAALRAGADIAVGSRILPDPSVVIQTRWHRKAAGQCFNWIVRTLGVCAVADTQCGFKLFRGHVADDLFRALRTDGFGFDVELVLLAQRRGYRISEVPINWTDQPGSKLGVATDAPRMLWEILSARANLARGRYDQ
jgi:dolichyl-phosphate beta-glucosyltransferase